jgi:hypothetical protein
MACVCCFTAFHSSGRGHEDGRRLIGLDVHMVVAAVRARSIGSFGVVIRRIQANAFVG